jgi:hypothetical protein
MTVTLRTTANDKATNKGSALSHAELDANFVHFLDNGLTVVGDDSTGTAFTVSDDIKIAGGTNITTAVSGPTLTISGATDITCNSLASSDSTAIQLNDALNVSGAITGGSTLTVDGASTLTGNVTASGTLGVTGASTFTTVAVGDLNIEADGTITSDTNGEIHVNPAGTGGIFLESTFCNAGTDRFETAYSDSWGQKGLARTYVATGFNSTTNATRAHCHTDYRKITSNGSDNASAGSKVAQLNISEFDLNGANYSFENEFAGHHGYWVETISKNGDSSNPGALYNMNGILVNAMVGTSSTNDMTVTNTRGIYNEITLKATSGKTATATNAYNFYSAGTGSGGSGTKVATNQYHYYAEDSALAPGAQYAFYTQSADALSKIGTLIQYKERVNALIDDSGAAIAVDCDLGSVFTYTVQTAQDLVITDLEEGQTVTIILRQDSGDSTVPNITFVGDDSVAVKFPGGAPTLTTETGAIDVVTIFNDGTDLLGNIVQDFK